MPHRSSEIHPEFLSNNALDPFSPYTSAARKQMFATHLSQQLVVSGCTERFIQTGQEREFGKYTFGTRVPEDVDIEILKIIDRYPTRTLGQDKMMLNPQKVIIYQEHETGRIGHFDIRGHRSMHQYFGFKYVDTPILKQLTRTSRLSRGTVLQHSPQLTCKGGYKYGVQLNVAMMSHPAVSEDGVAISRSALEKLKFKVYEKRVVSWGNNTFPINLYGTPERVKVFPDIGEQIRPDGLLMVTREYDEEMGLVNEGIYDAMIPDMVFDQKTYTRAGRGTIVDIEVFHDRRTLPNGMEEQVERYSTATEQFYQNILDEYNRIYASNRDVVLTPDFDSLCVHALAMTDFNLGYSVQKLNHKAPLDDWRVVFTIEYEITPKEGYKITGAHGDKGVIVAIIEDAHMPVDMAGNRAELIVDPGSTVNRMNLGRLYELYINACSRDLAKELRQTVNLFEQNLTIEEIYTRMQDDPDSFKAAWKRLLRYYQILSPRMYKEYSSDKYLNYTLRATHLQGIFTNGLDTDMIYLYLPTNNPVNYRKAAILLEKEFTPVYGPVTYTGYSGIQCTTELPIRIGSMYILLLEKISDDFTATASAKVQHNGILGQVTAGDKYSQPVKNQPIKIFGEPEVRGITSYCGGFVMADLMDKQNSAPTHKVYLQGVLRAKQPTNIKLLVDRSIHKLGNSMPLKLIKHIGLCSGYKYTYVPFVPHAKSAPVNVSYTGNA